MTIFLLLFFGGNALKHNDDGSIIHLNKDLNKLNKDPNKLNIRKKSQESYRTPAIDIADMSEQNPDSGEHPDNFDIGESLIAPRSNITISFRGSLLADLERSNKKNKQGQSCTPLDEVLRNSEELSLKDHAFVTSCNKQHYKNSGCYIKVSRLIVIAPTNPYRTILFQKCVSAVFCLQ